MQTSNNAIPNLSIPNINTSSNAFYKLSVSKKCIHITPKMTRLQCFISTNLTTHFIICISQVPPIQYTYINISISNAYEA